MMSLYDGKCASDVPENNFFYFWISTIAGSSPGKLDSRKYTPVLRKIYNPTSLLHRIWLFVYMEQYGRIFGAEQVYKMRRLGV